MRRNKEKGIHKWDMRITGQTRITLGGGLIQNIILHARFGLKTKITICILHEYSCCNRTLKQHKLKIFDSKSKIDK